MEKIEQLLPFCSPLVIQILKSKLAHKSLFLKSKQSTKDLNNNIKESQKNIEINSKLLSQQTAMGIEQFSFYFVSYFCNHSHSPLHSSPVLANAQLQIQELAEIVKQTKQVCSTTKENVKDAKLYLATGNLNIMVCCSYLNSIFVRIFLSSFFGLN